MRKVSLLLVLVTFLSGEIHAGPCPLFADPFYEFAALSSEVLDKFETDTPFAFACKDSVGKDSVRNRPKVEFRSLWLPARDSSGNQTKDFLAAILDRAADRNRESKIISDLISDCLEDDSNEDCKRLKEGFADTFADGDETTREEFRRLDMFSLIREGVRDARRNLGIFSEQMNPLGYQPVLKWKPLTPAELSSVREHVALARNEATKIVGKQLSEGKISPEDVDGEIQEKLLVWKTERFVQYANTIVTKPIVAYISEIPRSRLDIKKSLQKQAQHLQRTGDEVSKLRTVLRTNSLDTNLLQVLEFQDLIEQVLLENPKYCGLATSLTQIRQNRMIQGGALVVGGLGFASLLGLPVPLIVLLGGASGEVEVVKTLTNLQRRKDHLFSAAANSKGLARLNLEELESLSEEEWMVWYMLGAGGVSGISILKSAQLLRGPVKSINASILRK